MAWSRELPDSSVRAWIAGRRVAMPLLAGALAGSSMIAPAAAQTGDRALASPAAITGRDTHSRTLYLSLIENMRASGQVHAALAHLDAFDTQFPRSDEAAILRGNCLVDIADYPGAGAVFQRLVRGRHAAEAFAGLGRIEALNERWPAAVAHYARAVQRAPTQPLYLSDYGFALLRAGKPADAVFRLRQAVELAPADTRARNNLILALAAAGDEPAARRVL
ncbi:tetratricopeptide repeat protein, partial [Sphingomonas sp.]|uniref:tetratricopeptide repeat protein n=1 Tax=Sphingomonas sp. TaxID=28214 RepID=UPI002C1A7469